MTLANVTSLVKAASLSESRRLESDQKAYAKFTKAAAIRKKIAELTDKAETLRWEGVQALDLAHAHEYHARKVLEQARLEYTAPLVDFPSEGKARAWESFQATLKII